MSQKVDFDALVTVARGLLARPGRQVLAIAGAPGSGKSTLVERLAERLADPAVAILPMDGFHYDDAVLHAMGRRPWKGAPDTFDVGGLRSALSRLRDPAEGAVAAYEHVIGESWKPFERQADQPGETVGRKAAAAQMAAFE